MKKNIVIACIAGCMIAFTSCRDYLNMEHLLDDTLNLKKVFESKDYSDEWLAGVYSHLQNENMDVSSKGYTPFNLISDDMYYNDRRKSVDGGRTYTLFKNGEYNENWEQGSWGSCYQAIRDASTYIHNIDRCTEDLTKEEISDRKAQARFLRAYYYWLLLRKYGPIPLLPDEGLDFTKEYEDLAIPRSTYEECAEFIAGELALAAKDLPLERDNRNIAKPTRGAALASRAKVYLFSASPLFNGNTDAWANGLVNNEGKRLVSTTYDETKWAKAAAAAKEVIDLGIYNLYVVPFREFSAGNEKNQGYISFDYYRYPATIVPPYNDEFSDKDWPNGWRNIDPFESYRQLFNGDVQAYANPELIFTRGQNLGSEGIVALIYHQMPYSLKGWGAHGLTLKMYDAYYMDDGSDFPVDLRPMGYTTARNYTDYPPLPPQVSLQHANREPRFYASVAYNGCVWECEGYPITETNMRYKQVFYYRDSEDGKRPGETQFYLPTGVGIKKYYNPVDSDPANGGRWIPKPEPAIRYAEILLIYAEALNELTAAHTIPAYDGNGSITVSRNTGEMSKTIRPVRIRAGLPDYDQTVYSSPEVFRKKLKQERQIELMGEGHRYFDLRRWKDAPREEGMPVWGFNMNMPTSQRDLFDVPVELLSMPSIFVDKMYLWPISHNELRKNRKLTQNPGWTYFTE